MYSIRSIGITCLRFYLRVTPLSERVPLYRPVTTLYGLGFEFRRPEGSGPIVDGNDVKYKKQKQKQKVRHI